MSRTHVVAAATMRLDIGVALQLRYHHGSSPPRRPPAGPSATPPRATQARMADRRRSAPEDPLQLALDHLGGPQAGSLVDDERLLGRRVNRQGAADRRRRIGFHDVYSIKNFSS